MALPQQARVLVRRRATASSRWASTHAAAGADIVDVDDCHLASERNNAARNEVREWARANGLPPHESDGRARRPAPPRRPRGRPHRPGPDPPRHGTGQAPAPAGRPPHRHRRPLRRHRRPDRRARRGVPRGGAGRPSLPHLPPRLLPDQHRDGRAPLRDRRGVTPASAARERVYDLYCGIGTIGLSLAARAQSRSGASRVVHEAVADAERERERNGIGNAHFMRGRRSPGRPPASRAGRQPGRSRRRPAPCRPVTKDRPPPDRGRGATHRLRLLQPDDARAERGPARRGRLCAEAHQARRHVPPDSARRVRGAPGASRIGSEHDREHAPSASPPGSTRRSRRRSQPAARSSATARSGRTTHPVAERPRDARLIRRGGTSSSTSASP